MNTRKKRLPPLDFLVLLVAILADVLLVSASSRFSGNPPSQDQQQRPEFYAVEVVREKNVQNADDSLGEPDGRYAEILPGGQLVILMENKLYPLPMADWSPEGPMGPPDSGSIVGKGGEDFGLEGCFPMQDKQGKLYCNWILLGVSATGFYLGPPATYSFGENAGVDMIRITNPGTQSLFIDAVIGYNGDPQNK